MQGPSSRDNIHALGQSFSELPDFGEDFEKTPELPSTSTTHAPNSNNDKLSPILQRRPQPSNAQTVNPQATAAATSKAAAVPFRAGGATSSRSAMQVGVSTKRTTDAPGKTQRDAIADVSERIRLNNTNLKELKLTTPQNRVALAMQNGARFKDAITSEKAQIKSELEQMPMFGKSEEQKERQTKLKEALKTLERTTEESLKPAVRLLEKDKFLQSALAALKNESEQLTHLESGNVLKTTIPDNIASKHKETQRDLIKVEKQIDSLTTKFEGLMIENRNKAMPAEQKSALSTEIEKTREELSSLKSQRSALEKQLTMRSNVGELVAAKIEQVPAISINTAVSVSDKQSSDAPRNNYGVVPDPGSKVTIKHCMAAEEKLNKETGEVIGKRDVPGFEVTFTVGGREHTLKCPEHAIRLSAAEYPEGSSNLKDLFEAGQETHTFDVKAGMQFFSANEPVINCDVGKISEQRGGPQVMTFCDGCGWGIASKNAAETASSTAQLHVENALNGAKTLRDVAKAMMGGVLRAQEEIETKAKTTKIRDTTFNQIVVVDGYAVVAAVGDPKTFILRNGKAIDVTAGGRGNLHDASDSGGRLGVDSQGAVTADYHNLGLYVVKLEPGDIIVACSDGIHDNLDPETTNVSVKEAAVFCGMKQIPAGDWRTGNQNEIGLLKEKYIEAKFAQVAEGAKDEEDVIRKLQDHAYSTTLPIKLAMMQGSKVEGNYEKYPGKPDHAGMLAMKFNP